MNTLCILHYVQVERSRSTSNFVTQCSYCLLLVCHYSKDQKHLPRGVLKKAAPKNILKFIENQLCENVFFSKVTILQHTTFLKKIPTLVFSCDVRLTFRTAIPWCNCEVLLLKDLTLSNIFWIAVVSCWFTIQSFINLKVLFHKKVSYISQMFKNDSHLVVISQKMNRKRTLDSFSRKMTFYRLQFYKKRLQHRNFPASFTKSFWSFFVQNTFQWLNTFQRSLDIEHC